jgi:undecaprenyl-diphosphatase
MYVYEAYVRHLFLLDQYFGNLLFSLRSPTFTRCMIYVTDFLSPIHITLYALVLVLFLWLHKKNRSIEQFLFALLTGSIVVLFTKIVFKIPRPSQALIQEGGYSFASGHSAMATIFFLLVAHSYKGHIQNKLLRYLFVAGCTVLILLVGLSRVYLGVHYTTDVLSGFAIGAIVYAISILIFG